MPALIDTLLATPDNVEVVRDQIAAILRVEIDRQGELGLTPVPRVFVERSNPWGALVESPPNETPIINVWFDTATFDGMASNISERQRCDGTFNVDVYAFAASSETEAGHAPGDEAAAFTCMRVLRLVRQILMSGHYVYLGLKGLVWKRWPQTIGIFQPPIDARNAHHVVAGRLALAVQFNEFSPQVEGEPLETLQVEVFRVATGELYMSARYPSEGSSP
jgi:hypothetical protein